MIADRAVSVDGEPGAVEVEMRLGKSSIRDVGVIGSNGATFRKMAATLWVFSDTITTLCLDPVLSFMS